MQISKRNRIQKELFEAIKSCQAGVMDTFELELGNSPNWGNIRNRLLRCFGDRALLARINEILNAEFENGEK